MNKPAVIYRVETRSNTGEVRIRIKNHLRHR